MDKKKRVLPIYKYVVNPVDLENETLETNLKEVGVVDIPAIGVEFNKFSMTKGDKSVVNVQAVDIQQTYKFKLQETKDKRIVVGPVMIPDLPIYRINEDTGKEYFLVMDAETIENCRQKFIMNGMKLNKNHSTGNWINDQMKVFDIWKVQDPASDPGIKYGFTDLKPGTWMMASYVKDVKFWEENIKSGKLKGYSVEMLGEVEEVMGYMEVSDNNFTKLSKQKPAANYPTDEQLSYLADLIISMKK